MTLHQKHAVKVAKKRSRIAGLEALIETHEQFTNGERDHDYLRELRLRLQMARNQLKCMKPVKVRGIETGIILTAAILISGCSTYGFRNDRIRQREYEGERLCLDRQWQKSKPESFYEWMDRAN